MLKAYNLPLTYLQHILTTNITLCLLLIHAQNTTNNWQNSNLICLHYLHRSYILTLYIILITTYLLLTFILIAYIHYLQLTYYSRSTYIQHIYLQLTYILATYLLITSIGLHDLHTSNVLSAIYSRQIRYYYYIIYIWLDFSLARARIPFTLQVDYRARFACTMRPCMWQ
jgi:hypothetical protein